MSELNRWSKRVRPAALGAAGLALVLGLMGAGVASGTAKVNKPVTNFLAYVGGQGKANPKLPPVTIGIINQQTATDAIAPAWTTGANVAEEYLNQHTRGIDGHPVKVVLCKIPTTVASATACGQQFADNGAIDSVAEGAIDVGNTTIDSALKARKMPIFYGVGLSTVDEKYPYGFILDGDVTHVEAPIATFAKTYLHAKSVSISYPSNIPAEVTAFDIIDDALKYEGIKTIYSAGFTSSDTDLSAQFEAAHAGETTVFMSINSGGPVCSDTYLTLKSLGIHTKVIANTPCATPTNAKADGGQLPHDWYYAAATTVSGSPTLGLSAFEHVMTEYGKGPVGHNAWSANAFGEIATIAKFDTEILKAGQKITPAAVAAKARAFKGPVILGPPILDCGGFSGFPATCADLDSFFQNTSPNFMKPVVYWIGPPKGFKVSVTG
ncbi:MAG: ABC transporter substrate-binding protein [Acidimicrobiales bacterium]